MKLASTLLMLVAMIIAIPALASDLKVPNDTGVSLAERVDCATEGCDFYAGDGIGEFDDTQGEVMVGPVGSGAGTIVNVVLEVDLAHTWVGDLVLNLYYDEDGDGVADYGPVSALCRPQLDGCPLLDACCGCSGDIAGVYTFGDDGADPLGEADCPSFIEPGCFMPAIESAAGFADTFGGLPAGGDFWIGIADGAGLDPGLLSGWGVYVCTDATATDESSYSNVKSNY